MMTTVKLTMSGESPAVASTIDNDDDIVAVVVDVYDGVLEG